MSNRNRPITGMNTHVHRSSFANIRNKFHRLDFLYFYSSTCLLTSISTSIPSSTNETNDSIISFIRTIHRSFVRCSMHWCFTLEFFVRSFVVVLRCWSKSKRNETKRNCRCEENERTEWRDGWAKRSEGKRERCLTSTNDGENH